MSSPKCDLDKPGVKQLDQVGTYAIIANKKLHDRGAAHRFAVVNASEQWVDVDSVHTTHDNALSRTQKLMQ